MSSLTTSTPYSTLLISVMRVTLRMRVNTVNIEVGNFPS